MGRLLGWTILGVVLASCTPARKPPRTQEVVPIGVVQRPTLLDPPSEEAPLETEHPCNGFAAADLSNVYVFVGADWICFSGGAISDAALEATARDFVAGHGPRPVVLGIDRSVTYARLAEVTEELKRAGLESIRLLQVHSPE